MDISDPSPVPTQNTGQPVPNQPAPLWPHGHHCPRHTPLRGLCPALAHDSGTWMGEDEGPPSPPVSLRRCAAAGRRVRACVHACVRLPALPATRHAPRSHGWRGLCVSGMCRLAPVPAVGGTFIDSWCVCGQGSVPGGPRGVPTMGAGLCCSATCGALVLP